MWKRVVAVGLVAGLAASGAVAVLDDHPAPPRPEGTIAYSAPDFHDVFVAGADGSHVRRLTLPRSHSSTPASPPTAA